MGRGSRRKANDWADVTELLNHLLVDKLFISLAVFVILVIWAIERWLVSLSSVIPIIIAVWGTIQYGNTQRQTIVEDLNNKWKRVILSTSSITPLEHCEWLNKLLLEIWPKYINPILSSRFSSIVEKRLKHRKSRLIERIELKEFCLGSCPPSLGLEGAQWSTLGEQRIMRLGFLWDTNAMSIMLLAKLAKPFMGTARIVINSIHIKGDLLLMPILDGNTILYSFVSTPEVRIGVAFGSGGSQSLPATELPGVSTWLVKIFTDTLTKTMVEPRRRCFSLSSVNLRKKVVGGIIYVTVVSANKLSGRQQNSCSSPDGISTSKEVSSGQDLQTFIEVELGELTRRTTAKPTTNPNWGSTFNMVLHEDVGILRFHLFECTLSNVKFDHLASCEIGVKYVADDSTTFWAIGRDCGVVAKHAELCGKEVEMVVPFEGFNSGELKVKLVLKEWQFSDGSSSLNNNIHMTFPHEIHASNSLPKTGRKINITVVEGKDLVSKDKSGKSNQYVKLQYGKTIHRTSGVANASNALWNQKFEVEESSGDEYVRIRCYSEETFGDDTIGCARVNLEGLVDGSIRDVWVPLEKVSSGELRLQIEALKPDDGGSGSGAGNGWIELVLIEARDLIAADLRGTSDPYVRVHYGNYKRKTKVMYRNLNPQWNQTMEFPDDGSPLELHVKDHNALLPTSNIGDCTVEYQRLAPNQVSDKWIPLQGVKRGEIHVRITRKVPEFHKKHTLDSESSSFKTLEISTQMKEMMKKFRGCVEDGNTEGLCGALSELESLEEMQEEYILQLETEQSLLLDKINELGHEFFNSASSTT